jgi:hypothetical protein
VVFLQNGQNGHTISHSGKPLFPGFDKKAFSKEDKDAARSQEYFKDRSASITLRNQIQLSTYGDSIGGDLEHLRKFADKHLGGECAVFNVAWCSESRLLIGHSHSKASSHATCWGPTRL